MHNGGVEHEIGEFRKRVLDRVLLFVFAALATSLATTFGDAFFVGEAAIFHWVLLPSALCVGWAALSRDAPARFRQLVLVVGLLTATFGTALKSAYLTPNAFSGQLMLLVLVALVIGRRAARIVLAIVMLAWLAIALRFVGGAQIAEATTFDPSVPSNWLRVLGIFAVVAFTCVTAVTYLFDKLVGTVRRAEGLYAALTEESTARIAALEAQQQLHEHLRQARKLEALGTLAGGVAHDFNNLLMVIIGHAELASDPQLPASSRESLTEIRAAAERARLLTQQLLAFGRRQVANRSAVTAARVAEDTLKMLRRLLPTTIEVELHDMAPEATVWADAVELSQVIMNLCVNGRDAMPEGGRLSISLREVDHAPNMIADGRRWLQIQIEDTGMGMDAQTRERAFDPFFTTKQPGAGTGLGLSTVHGIVEQLGGFAQLASAPAQGTTANVWLPLCSAHSALAEPPPVASEQRGHELILVVDDDRGAREVNAAHLRRGGYRVILCEDGERALEAYRRQRDEIALIVSDAVMPKLGGRELHREITREFGEVPFLVCSGYTDQTFGDDFFAHPLRAFLAKPYSRATLLEHVRGLIDAHAATRRAQRAPAIADPVLHPNAGK